MDRSRLGSAWRGTADDCQAIAECPLEAAGAAVEGKRSDCDYYYCSGSQTPGSD